MHLRRRSVGVVLATALCTAGLSAGAAQAQTHSSTSSSKPASATTATPKQPTDDLMRQMATRAAVGPSCVCSNVAQYKSANKLMQVDTLNHRALLQRLGDRTAAQDVYVTMTAATAKGAPAVKKIVPFPDWNARSRTTYAKSRYYVYWMYGRTKGPSIFLVTWKYGITRQSYPPSRPERQLPACNRYFDHRYYQSCDWEFIWTGFGWFQARTVEATYTLAYALENGGKCPPGMPACV